MAQSSIDFLLNNNIAIIQGVFALIFILVVFVILRSFKKDSEEHVPPRPTSVRERREEAATVEKKVAAPAPAAMPAESSPLDDLDNLDDLMGSDKDATQAEIDQTMSQPTTPPVPEINIPPPADFEEAAKSAPKAAPTAAPASAPTGELASALSEKEKVISDLKNEIKSLQDRPAAASGNSAELEAKVKELTEKLSEYEIIEDDIANLSFYKTENTKLKNDLEKLRSQAGAQTEAGIASVDAAIAAAAAPAPAPVVPTPPPPAPEPVIAAEPPPLIVPAPDMPSPSASEANSILDEFEEAVKQKEALEKNIPKPSVSEPISVSSADTDLLKEFENAVERELAPQAAAVAPQAPAAPAPTPEPTPAPVAAAPVAAPAEDVNDKLVQEMEALATTKPPEVIDDGKDANQKLLEEFENFVNKV